MERVIELRLREVSQLFNSLDPSPFKEKDLDHDAEEYIVSWALEFPHSDPVKIRIHIDQWPQQDPAEMIRTAIRNYFGYEAEAEKREFRRLMETGRRTLLIGLTFMGLCFLSGSLVESRFDTVWTRFFSESLIVVGWVAMWRPLEIYLYDWWPVRQRIRVFEKLNRAPVEVVPAAK